MKSKKNIDIKESLILAVLALSIAYSIFLVVGVIQWLETASAATDYYLKAISASVALTMVNSLFIMTMIVILTIYVYLSTHVRVEKKKKEVK